MASERASRRAFFGVSASFTGMWVVMILVMLLPSPVPTL
jgi:predicted metal-binding membrane protein